jgi:hypothetical protein
MRRPSSPAGPLVAIAATALFCAFADAQQGAVTSEVLGRIDSPRASTGDSFLGEMFLSKFISLPSISTEATPEF